MHNLWCMGASGVGAGPPLVSVGTAISAAPPFVIFERCAPPASPTRSFVTTAVGQPQSCVAFTIKNQGGRDAVGGEGIFDFSRP